MIINRRFSAAGTSAATCFLKKFSKYFSPARFSLKIRAAVLFTGRRLFTEKPVKRRIFYTFLNLADFLK